MSINIQSLSMIVPPKPGECCLNRCVFGVCYQNRNRYENKVEEATPDQKMYIWEDYVQRLEIVKTQGTDTVIITGDIEPMGNEDFISWFGFINKNVLSNPFKIIELQTAGNKLNERSLSWLRNTIGVKTISLSLSSFDDEINAELTRNKEKIKIKELCDLIISFGFNLRLSLNLNSVGFKLKDSVDNGSDYVKKAKELNAHQVTLRYLYEDGSETKTAKWVRENRYNSTTINSLCHWIKIVAEKVGVLPYGADLYSYEGMSIAIDNDCMSKDAGKDIKYLVLGPDAKLYRDWNKTLYV